MSLKQVMSALAVSSVLSLPALASDYLDTSTSFSDETAEIEEFKGEASQLTTVIAPEGTKANHLLLAGVGNPAELSRFEAEKLGASIAAALKPELESVVFDTRLISNPGIAAELSSHMAHGIDLRNYRFDRYQSEPKERPQTAYHWLVKSPDMAEKKYLASRAIAEGKP